MPVFHIRTKYVDAFRLKDALSNLFFHRGRFLATIPRNLTEAEIKFLNDSVSRYHYIKAQNEHIEGSRNGTLQSSTTAPQYPAPAGAVATDGMNLDDEIPEALWSGEKTTSVSLPLNMSFPTDKPHISISISIKYEGQDGRVTEWLYQQEFESGEASKVFSVTASFSSSVGSESRPTVQKLAIKRLKESTPAEEFVREYKSLKQMNLLQHPNIVQTLSVFKYECEGIQYFNFAFPLALGNLKRLFRGDYNEILNSKAFATLWTQFNGLASVVVYLHETVRRAHRDIKPSNILVYEGINDGGLNLKLTDFGLSVDLTEALSWEAGSAATQSAGVYDSPGLRSSLLPSSGDIREVRVPSIKELLANDMWRLGCVFTELVTFLVEGGSEGVLRFNEHRITVVENVSSDSFSDTRFDDGEKVKPQVLSWIMKLASVSEDANKIMPLLYKMLSEVSTRPTARETCQRLLDSRISQTFYDDGIRIVQFIPPDSEPKMKRLDQFRLEAELRLGRSIDWHPLPPLVKPCAEGSERVVWQWGARELSIVLSDRDALYYKLTCVPIFGGGEPILPLSTQQAKVKSTAAHTQGSSAPPSQPTQSTNNSSQEQVQNNPSLTSTPGQSKQLYWCVDRVFSEPLQTVLFPIREIQGLQDDEQFYLKVNKRFNKVRGGKARGWVTDFFSWKRCTEVNFIKFHVVKDNSDRVFPTAQELPPSGRGYEHQIKYPKEVHMQMAAIQMVTGLMYPKEARGEKTMITILPRKLVPPTVEKIMGAEGWGLHAKMGFSILKIARWFISCSILSVIFAGLWLGFVSNTDLQNAFIPTTVLFSIITLFLAIPQVMEK
ncbi:kinase-like domain-containing protein [Hypoxylon trugodes]|uniref:kinase-like domain-containing protein n=1 Tax=Hypoxylon trugodes TaxID=326681 RepID=UPI002193C33D|nr:kinase-like domain-containing protein [Hypoxylon trugodes]KAI1390684.1 kinase-like domain-containing protein [Hypoxylon trugodes]